jgi:bifunctional enzyme CysN/CysC/sulfate adenylyltransferase subunit 1
MISALDHTPRAGFDLFLEQHLDLELLRFTTAGSVDDGKSTLIGRLLHDSKSVYEDQLESLRTSRLNRSIGPLDFSLLTDGLRAEREQGITIDVAYRYFVTARRKFIIADTPGHEQYTRNMATGASTADLAVILIDCTKGVLSQTRRHARIAALLGIPNLLIAINKMDLAGFRQESFDQLKSESLALAEALAFSSAVCIPVSALAGDNVATRSHHMPWYSGPTMLEHLESVPLGRPGNAGALRFPVQYVIRPNSSFRGFAGQIAGGRVRPGDFITALPSGQTTRVQSIVTFDGELSSAVSPMSVALRLEDEIDLSRGDMLVAKGNLPHVSRHFLAMLVWMSPQPLVLGATYILMHTTRRLRATIRVIRYRVNVDTAEQEPALSVSMNEIAAVEIATVSPLFFDPYSRNRTTGSFILIDPLSNATVGAAMIQEPLSEIPAPTSSSPGELGDNKPLEPIRNSARARKNGHYSAAVSLSGRLGVAIELEKLLFRKNFQVTRIGDQGTPGNDLAAVAGVLQAAGLIVIYCGAQIGRENKEILSKVFTDCYLDLDTANLSSHDDVAIHEAAQLVQSLSAVNLSSLGEAAG